MVKCPVKGCGKIFKRVGLRQHMTKMHPDWVLVDSDKLIYRAPDQAPTDESASSRPVRTLKNQPLMRKAKLPVAVGQSDPPTQRVVIERRRISTKKKKPIFNLKAVKANLKKRVPDKKERKPQDRDPNWDPEPTLEIVTKIPLLIILALVAYKYFTNPEFFMQFLDNDVIEVYKFVFTDISSPGSIIILVLTAIILFLVLFIMYKMVWRFMFKDLQIRKGFTPGELHRKGPGTSFEGRIMLIVGDGFWDRIYRRITKVPKPKILTIFYRRSFRDPSVLNPFKVLASCHKGYLDNTNGGRFIRDGLFKRTLIATHMRRDTENESVVYWFEDGLYEAKSFTADWYRRRHKGVIREHLAKVSKACLMDSTTQKRQMENVISWLPTTEIEEQERVWELKKEAQAKAKAEEEAQAELTIQEQSQSEG